DLRAVPRFYFSEEMLYAGLILQLPRRQSIIDDIGCRHLRPPPAVGIDPSFQLGYRSAELCGGDEVDGRPLKGGGIDEFLAEARNRAEWAVGHRRIIPADEHADQRTQVQLPGSRPVMHPPRRRGMPAEPPGQAVSDPPSGV